MSTMPDEQPPGTIPDKPEALAPSTVDATAQSDAVNDSAPAAEVTLAGGAMNLLAEHKGKLAIGVAATLGMMVYYGWREKRLAKTDPEEYARLQRLKAVMRHSDDPPRAKTSRKAHAPADAAPQPVTGTDAPAPTEAPPDVS